MTYTQESTIQDLQRQPCEIYSRVNGYMRPVQSWNDAKRAEFRDRKTFKLNEEDNI